MNMLGVIVQCNLKWDELEHINIIITKVNSRKFLISTLKRAGVDKEPSKVLLYNS